MRTILIHTIAFSPDRVSTAYIYNDIVVKFQKEGYRVLVVTTTPHYNPDKYNSLEQQLSPRYWGLYHTSNFRGNKVFHIPQKKFKNTLLRLIGFVYWHIVSFFLIAIQRKIDLILSPSPPLTIGILNIILGKIKRAKVIYNVQEVYPDLLINQRNLKSRLIIRPLESMERFIYSKSDAVTTIHEAFFDTILPRMKEKSNLHIIPNFVDTSIYRPMSSSDLLLDKSIFPLNDSLKVMFAGNIGLAQDWDLLVSVADELRDDSIEFFVIGDGAKKSYLKSEIEDKDLSNIHIIAYQPRKVMPAIIAYSDIQFIFMSQKTESLGFPSKVYTIMACGRAMLISSGRNTPIVKFMQNKQCSFIVDDADFQSKVLNVTSILKSVSKSSLLEYGGRARDLVLKEYSSRFVTDMYIKLANSLL